MKFDPNKAYPYPVLRPGSSSYPRAAFEVELEAPQRIEGTTALRIEAEFQLSDPTLQGLVKRGKAEYVLLVRSPSTHHRSAHSSSKPHISKQFKDGKLARRVEIRGLLATTQYLPDFQAKGWHDDYRGLSFPLQAGSVLAEDEPREYWIDTAEEAPVASIFELRPDSKLAPGKGWRCDLGENKIILGMSQSEYNSFQEARNRVNGKPDAWYIMNAIYLPALVYVLQEADKDKDGDYDQCRWFRSLNKRLEDCDCSLLGQEGQKTDRLSDAQTLLEQPYAKMPLITGEAGGGT